MSNASKCVLSAPCKLADTAQCNDLCGHYIAMHTASGRHTLANIPSDYRYVTLETSPARTEQAQIYDRLRKYVATFERQFEADSGRIKSVYLYSESPGTGKTTTAAALINEWLRVHYLGAIKRGQKAHKRPAYFFDANAFQSLFNRVYMTTGARRDELGEQFDAERTKAIEAPFAVIDDIGVRESTEGFRGHLHDVINERTVSGKPTVFTSNVPTAELESIFDARLADRVRDMCFDMEFGGESKRGRR